MPNIDPDKLRLLHTADLHLGAPFNWLGDRAASRQADLLRTFRRIVDCAIDQQVEMLIVAGDLFDQPQPETALLLAVQRELSRLPEHAITAVLLPGTHDGVWGGATPYQDGEFPGVIILDRPLGGGPLRLDINGKQVWLYGSAYRGEKPERIFSAMRRQEGKGFHLGVLHGSQIKASQWNYRDKDLPFSFDEMNSWGLDYVALGHYHSFQLLEQGGEVLACYPGSPEGKQFSESGERYVALVEIGTSGNRVEALAIQSRTLATLAIDMGLEPSLESLQKKLAGLADENLLLRVELTGPLDVPIDIADLQARHGDGFFYLELQDKTQIFEGSFVRQLAQEETIAGLCMRRFQELLVDQPDNREVIEAAMKEVVLRFRAEPGFRS